MTTQCLLLVLTLAVTGAEALFVLALSTRFMGAGKGATLCPPGNNNFNARRGGLGLFSGCDLAE